MITRFQGTKGCSVLVETLKGQTTLNGNVAAAEFIAKNAELIEVPAGQQLITQGADDNDMYFIVTGSFDIVVNGRVVAVRSANNHVGEMSAVQPTQPRSATVTSREVSVVCKVTEAQLAELAKIEPAIWKGIAKELARRLEERNALVTSTRDKIRVFVISSAEALEIARTIQNAFEYDDFRVTVWTDGVFRASWYPVESLEAQIDQSDFAIAIVQPDDVTRKRGADVATPRDNVIFELGLFIGRLGRKRSFLVEPRGEEVELPSDLKGITALTYKYDPKALPEALAPVCNKMRLIIKDLGPN
jgi:predicted nucleotide-binding protein